MRIFNNIPSDITSVSNTFIDQYMIAANGEFVKIYLYLLRLSGSCSDISLTSLADALEITEKDVERALSYWEKLQLLHVNFDQEGCISSLTFLEAPVGKKRSSSACAAPAASCAPTQKLSADKMPSVSRTRMASLCKQEDVRQLFFVAEQYLQRPLTSSEQEEFLYYYDSLHFSMDLIEYLLEYCISKGSASRHYMRKVALSWSEAGITTVARAREETNLYNKNYFSILNAFGIKGRNPATPELELMAHWINELGFTLDIILEACRRTITQTHQPNFQYTNKILEEWRKRGVHCTADIVKLDQQRAQAQKAKQQTNPSAAGNRFHNFNQREYDYNQLERKLLNS